MNSGIKSIGIFVFLFSVLMIAACDSSLTPAGYIGGPCVGNTDEYCIEGICVDGKCVEGSLDGDATSDQDKDPDKDKTEFYDVWVDADNSIPVDGDNQDNDKTPDGDLSETTNNKDFDKDESDIEQTNLTWLDSTTGLRWQKTSDNTMRNWLQSKAYCKSLEIDGYSDWRLPNISELRSIVRGCESIETAGLCGVRDTCIACGIAAIDMCLATMCWSGDNCDPVACTDSGGATGCYLSEKLDGECHDYWSASTREGAATNAWHLHFKKGSVNNKHKDMTSYVRCVRGGGVVEDGDSDETETEEIADIPVPDGDEVELDEGDCADQVSYSCSSGDVYWYDSCQNRQEKKEECRSCSCNLDECFYVAEHSSVCNGGDSYWYDCMGNQKSIKESCDDCGCLNGECKVNNEFSYQCESGDVYWYDCHNDKAAKKKECNNCECSAEACIYKELYAKQCNSGDIYWFDCMGARKAKVEECDACSCESATCIYNDKHSYTCNSGDVYYYDCRGERKVKKEECSQCACTGNSCDYVQNHHLSCSGGDVYWYDCKGSKQGKKEECDDCSCSSGSCVYNAEHTSQCYSGDVWWYDCRGARKTKKQECGSAPCSGGKCQGLANLSCNTTVCTDSNTGITWQKQAEDAKRTWADADTYCKDLSLGGYTNWRLPNISELRTIAVNCSSIQTAGACGVKHACSKCNVSSSCLSSSSCYSSTSCSPSSCGSGCYWATGLTGPCKYYWSSSTVSNETSYAWRISYGEGDIIKSGKTGSKYVMCVR